MKNMDRVLSSLASALHTGLIILLPLFFLTTTQEFYSTNKFYLLAAGVLVLLFIMTLNFLVNKKIQWVSSPLDTILIGFVILYSTSLLIASPNKVQALLNPTHGLVLFITLTLFYFITVHFKSTGLDNNEKLLSPLHALYVSAVVLAIGTIVFFFEPFRAVPLPVSLSFLKNPQFTPAGTQLEVALFLGFFVVFGLAGFATARGKKSYATLGATVLLLVALTVTVYTLFKPLPQTQPVAAVLAGPKNIISSLPPFAPSWYGGLESLKNWKTAVFGFGVDNFGSVFTKVKPLTYNDGPLWTVNFNDSRSALLGLWGEGGLLSIAAFLVLLGVTSRLLFIQKADHEGKFSSVAHLFGGTVSQNSTQIKLAFLYVVLALLLLPASLLMFFVLFLLMAQVASSHTTSRKFTTDLTNLTPVVGLLCVLAFLVLAASSYFLGRSYLAEYYFKDSVDALAQNDGQKVYTNMRQAIILNPFIERYRTSFSQLNLLLANNIARRATEPSQLTEEDRQNIGQAVQASIAEAKAVVVLNPQKAVNWENLAVIYRNLLNAAEGADAWTLSSYQRAIILDPQNPIYRLNLGGVFYSLGNYKEAARFFEQAISLKPDWPNAHYNMAWASFQNKDFNQAVVSMQNVISLLDPKIEKQDLERAQKELAEFKKSIPEATDEATPAGTSPTQLRLETPPAATVEPKLKLPEGSEPPEEEATPSAR